MADNVGRQSLERLRKQLSTLNKDELTSLLQGLPALGSPASVVQPYRKHDSCVEVAERLIWEFDQRTLCFPDCNFPDGAWLILLDLYDQQGGPLKISISSACIAARVPLTTALRHIRRLLDDGWLIKISDLHDRRKHYLELSETAKLFMTRYLTRIREPNRSRHRTAADGNFLRLVADRGMAESY